jgi:hypothetical protein
MNVRDGSLWFGVLDAGQHSSPVVFDARLDTGNPTTIYLFNLARRRMIEYRADIVVPKLRELSADEATKWPRLHDAFLRVRAAFEPRRRATPVVPVAHHWWIGLPGLDDFGSEEVRSLLMGEGLDPDDDEERPMARDDDWLEYHVAGRLLAVDLGSGLV